MLAVLGNAPTGLNTPQVRAHGSSVVWGPKRTRLSFGGANDAEEWAPKIGAFGNYARITSAGAFSNNCGTGSTCEAFGAGASTQTAVGSFLQLAVGNAATTSAANAVALGPNTSASQNPSVAIGPGATASTGGYCVIGSGSSPITDLMLGSGLTNGSPSAVTIHGCGASGSNIAGASLTLAPGIGTGTGVPGTLLVKQAPIGGSGSGANSLSTVATWGTDSSFALTPFVSVSGSPFAFKVTGAAHTTLAASTEATDINFNLARTVQFATGALTTQRAVQFQAPTYGFVGASTLSTAVTVDISGPPVQGTNATITSAIALRVGGLTQINGNLQLGTAGNKLLIATGSNASAGTGTLSGGTATVSTTAVTASSLIFLQDTSTSVTNVGVLTVSAISAGVSFTVTSTVAIDSSTFNWHIIN